MKALAKALLFIVASLMIASPAMALSLMTQWDNTLSSKTINPGQGSQYYVAAVGDQGLTNIKATATLYDYTTGQVVLVKQLWSQTSTDVFYYPNAFTITPSDYGSLPGNYFIDVKIEQTHPSIGTTIESSQLYLDVTGSRNQPPIADFIWTPANPVAGQSVTLTSTSYDPDGSIAAYKWTLAGQTISTSQSFNYVFNTAGTYQVTLEVTDNSGATASVAKNIIIGSKPNQPPVADFTWTPSNPNTDDTVTFTSTSTDSDGTIAKEEWTIDGHSYTGHTAPYKFATAGTYAISLKATDNNGATDTKTKNIVVSQVPPQNKPPIANFTWNPANPIVAQSVRFTSTSTDSDGFIASYKWTMGGQALSTSSYFDRSFSTAGDYQITLEVTDNGGLKDSITKTITIGNAPNVPPKADFYWSPSNPVDTDTITFTSNSTDSDGYITQSDWYIDGTYTASGTSFSKQLAAGTYSIKITVTDNDGATSSKTKTLIVAKHANQAPVADFNYTPSNPTTTDSVKFTSTSYDPDGTLASQYWYINGTYAASGNTFPNTFTTPGSYAVKLTITDNDGATASKTKIITVTKAYENQPPIADFNYTPTNPKTTDNVKFTSTSYDPDGYITMHDWYANGTHFGSGSEISKAFTVPGSYAIRLTVTDNSGATASKTKTITVAKTEEKKPPVADFIWTPSNPIAGQTIRFNSTSYDTDGTITKEEWDLNNDGVYEQTGHSVTWQFQNSGNHPVTIRVTDNDGLQSTKTKTVVVGNQILLLDELGCNSDVVKGNQQHCSVHVRNDVEGADIVFKYVDNNQVLGTCETNFKGYCHINPIINRPAGYYEVYAEAQKTGYDPDLTHALKSKFRVWDKRYDVNNLKVFKDAYVTEADTFYRSNPMYACFDVYDTFTNMSIPPGAGLVQHVFLRVNNQNELNFTEYNGGSQMLELAAVPVEQVPISVQNQMTMAMAAGDAGCAYKYKLVAIPLTDDYLGQGKVFAFVFNFTDNTAGEKSKNVNILNNPVQFNPPAIVYIQPGSSVELDMKSYLSDVETPVNEIKVTNGDSFPITIQYKGMNIFAVKTNSNFKEDVNVFWTADDTDGSVVTKTIIFRPNITQGDQPPVAEFTYKPLVPFTGDVVNFTSTSYDPDGYIKSYEWKLDGSAISTADRFSHVFENAGTYTVSLTVTDDANLQSTVSKTIIVCGKNQTNETNETNSTSPVAILRIPSSVRVSEAGKLDGSQSYDPMHKAITQYTFDIIQFGKVQDSITTTSSILKYNFSRNGATTVRLTVMTEDGRTGATQANMFVGQNPVNPEDDFGKDLFVQNFFVDDGSGKGEITIGEPFTVTASIQNKAGRSLRGLRITFQIPELGYSINGENFDLSNGQSKDRTIYGDLPFTASEVPPGDYYALIGVEGDGFVKTKYFPLIIR